MMTRLKVGIYALRDLSLIIKKFTQRGPAHSPPLRRLWLAGRSYDRSGKALSAPAFTNIEI